MARGNQRRRRPFIGFGAITAGGVVAAATAGGFAIARRLRRGAADPVETATKFAGIPIPKFLRKRGRTKKSRIRKIIELRTLQREEAARRRRIPLTLTGNIARALGF